ncbi:MAG: hypothetical protein U0V48_11645 [Anaerolineales bacterium]
MFGTALAILLIVLLIEREGWSEITSSLKEILTPRFCIGIAFLVGLAPVRYFALACSAPFGRRGYSIFENGAINSHRFIRFQLFAHHHRRRRGAFGRSHAPG